MRCSRVDDQKIVVPIYLMPDIYTGSLEATLQYLSKDGTCLLGKGANAKKTVVRASPTVQAERKVAMPRNTESQFGLQFSEGVLPLHFGRGWLNQNRGE